MNILFLTRLYHPHIGGVEKHLEKISQLLKKKHQITIITEQHDRKLKQSESTDGITIYRIPVLSTTEKQKKLVIWKWLWKNRHLIIKADIIHIHDVIFWFFPFRILFPFKKVFITFHGYEANQPVTLSAIIQRKLGEVMSAGNICVGDFLKKWYKANPTAVTYGAADLQPQPPPQKQSAIFVGRLDHDTGIGTLLKGVSLQESPLSLHIYGTGPLESESKKYAHKHHLPATFKGPSANASKEIAQHRYAFVSGYLSILEAMQTKRLVFAYYHNELKKGYLTCHPQAKNMIIFHTPEELIKALEQIKTHPLVEKRYIDNGYTWAKQQTWSKLVKEYLDLWRGKN